MKVLFSKEEPIKNPECSVPGSISFVPPVAGLLIAGEVIKDLLREEKDNGKEKVLVPRE